MCKQQQNLQNQGGRTRKKWLQITIVLDLYRRGRVLFAGVGHHDGNVIGPSTWSWGQKNNVKTKKKKMLDLNKQEKII